jgi:predicted RecB family nuclease
MDNSVEAFRRVRTDVQIPGSGYVVKKIEQFSGSQWYIVHRNTFLRCSILSKGC